MSIKKLIERYRECEVLKQDNLERVTELQAMAETAVDALSEQRRQLDQAKADFKNALTRSDIETAQINVAAAEKSYKTAIDLRDNIQAALVAAGNKRSRLAEEVRRAHSDIWRAKQVELTGEVLKHREAFELLLAAAYNADFRGDLGMLINQVLPPDEINKSISDNQINLSVALGLS